MGERKGTNHYYPPDYDPKKGGLNKFLGTHALRERARKMHLGILIIRFEMPYNIWCLGCNNHIGMGVRYNAEKKKIGMYYSTPIYQFRMKCHLCDNHFEIKTDPANLDYVIVSGARRQENRWDPKQNEQVVPEDKETSKRLFDDAMFKLEHGEGDKKTALHVKPTLARLAAKRDEVWQDDYAANCILRAKFRAKKREQQAKHAKDEELLAKSSLSLSLLPESEEDANLAAKLSLKCASAAERRLLTVEEIISSPVLPGCPGTTTSIHSDKTVKQLAALEKDRAVLGGIIRRHLPVDTVSTETIAVQESNAVLCINDISATEDTAVSHRKDMKSDDTEQKHENKSLSLILDYNGFSSSDEGSNIS